MKNSVCWTKQHQNNFLKGEDSKRHKSCKISIISLTLYVAWASAGAEVEASLLIAADSAAFLTKINLLDVAL